MSATSSESRSSSGPAGFRSDAGWYVHESGAPDAPTVVFLHGSGASGRMWRKHMASLVDRFHCVAPDLPGFGRSNRLPPLTRAATADLVAALVAARAAGARAHVVGLSWGGGVAHAMLEHHADRVDRAIIDGAGVLSWWANGPFLAGITAMSPFLHTRPVVALLGDLVGMDEEGREDLRASSRRAFRRAFIDGFHAQPSEAELAAPCPTLLVAGEGESVVRRSNSAQAALMPHALAIYAPGGRHGWLGARTDVHVRMVEAWLTDRALPTELRQEPPPAPAALEQMRREAVPLRLSPGTLSR